MKKILIANFKMNKNISETKKYLDIFKENYKSKKEKQVVFCPSFTSLHLSKKYKMENVFFGAQNMNEESNGSYTGEISAEMLKEADAKFVILGHSERRKHFNENNEKINRKIKTALRYGLQVVLCVGETRAQKNTNKTAQVLEKQIAEALSGIYSNELKGIIIAYEPVWAVGTGKIADSKDISKSTQIIREIIDKLYSSIIDIRVVYGGSLTSQSKIFKNKNVDGFLVGGSSLNVYEFLKILDKI